MSSPRIEALRYLLTRASVDVDNLRYYIDNTLTVGMRDHDSVRHMIELCRDIVEEMMLP